jgi:glycosyltransferase involved in cell wall biosynthesis
MHAVIIDGDVSYPATSGKRLRTLHLMLHLARRHRLTYIARGQEGPAAIREATAFLHDRGIETVIVDSPLPRKSGPAFALRLAANLLSPLPYSAASHHCAPLCRAVADYAARHSVDLWQFEWTPFVWTLPRSRRWRSGLVGPAAPRVLMAPNVDTLIWQRYHETERHPLKRWYIGNQWRKFERLERRVFAEVDRVVTVSAEDAALVRTQFGVDRVDVVENGIDAPYFADVRAAGRSGTLLFLGSLDWRPNLDAVSLLLDTIFPAVRSAIPDARLVVVGRNPPAWLAQRIRGLEGVELHGDVPDVRPFLAASGALVVPLRIGGGSRLKILEALACGLPVVSTRVGAEGLALEAGRDLVVVDSVEQMAPTLVECIRDPQRARRLAESGRGLVLERYDWEALAGKLEAVWEKCLVAGQKETACASCS